MQQFAYLFRVSREEGMMSNFTHLALQAASNPEFIAYKLAIYQQKQRIDDEALASQLHCSQNNLTRLRLCTLPRPDYFQKDVEYIAAYAHVDVEELTKLLS